jgi:hypothetical protein
MRDRVGPTDFMSTMWFDMGPVLRSNRDLPRGRKAFVFDPPSETPDEWELDERGRPTWLVQLAPPRARWAQVFRDRWRSELRFELPTLDRVPPEHHGYGRPRNRETKSELLREAAWLYAFGERGSYADKARQLGLDPKGWRTVKSWVRQAEALLHEEGVLPWAAFPTGSLPERWWEDDAFTTALLRWRANAFADLRRELLGRALEPVRAAQALVPVRALEPVRVAQALVQRAATAALPR